MCCKLLKDKGFYMSLGCQVLIAVLEITECECA